VKMPPYGLDPAIYGPLERQCQDVLGVDRSEALAGQGVVLTQAQLLDLVESRVGEATTPRRPSGTGTS
jgi:hypothetical protein